VPRLLIALPMLAFLISLAHALAAPIPEAAKKPVLYFPVQKGARWVYVWSGGSRKTEEVVEVVTAVEDGKDGAKLITVARVGRDEKPFPFQIYEVSNRGLFWKKNLVGASFDPPTCALKLPHKSGQTWRLSDPNSLNTRLTALGPEKVEVPAGEFECIRVEQRDDRSPDPTQTRWYAPGIGQVQVRSGDLLIVLKSFTAGKD
jgi:hypothetical protein